jgi:hypothetical protein
MCEGWNNKFFNLVEHAHPSTCIWRINLGAQLPLVGHQGIVF